MIRYCRKCGFDEPKLDINYLEVCPDCGEFMQFTLRQRHWFLHHFLPLTQSAYGLTVKKCMFGRGGESGTLVDVWEYGPHLDFFGKAPSIEAYEWDEVDIANILPQEKDQRELFHLDIQLFPTLEKLQIGDRIMLRNGKTFTLSRRVKTRDHSKKLHVSGIDILEADIISAKTLHKIVDWLPKSEMDMLTEKMKETYAV